MTPTLLPPPSVLLGHPKFTSWYPGQAETFSKMATWAADDRAGVPKYLCIPAPTGSGKSVLAVLTAAMSGKRMVYCTATRGLESQLMGDFEFQGMVNIHGQGNYPCRASQESSRRDFCHVDDAPCHAGRRCRYKLSGCYYYDALSRAIRSGMAVTNYDYYLAQTNHSPEGLGRAGLLVCDEVHLARSALEVFMTTTITREQLRRLGSPPPQTGDCTAWREWGRGIYRGVKENHDLNARIVREYEGRPPDWALRAYHDARRILQAVDRVVSARGDWVLESGNEGVKLTPLWPGLVSRYLFGSVAKVVLMSATLTPKTLELLGVPEDQQYWVQVPSYFPPQLTPVSHYPSVRVDYRTKPEGLRHWVHCIDQIIDHRLDRKGLVFTVSYERTRFFLEHTRHRNIAWTHDRQSIGNIVQAFKAASAPAILVSPAISSGWDFPDDECRYIVVGKVPYPDTSHPLMKARMVGDRDLPAFQAMETMVQAAGRGTRSAGDWCEVIVADDNWRWFQWKYRHFAPQYFLDRLTGSIQGAPVPRFRV